MGFLSKSPWVIHYDGSSCNGCDIEVLAALMPRYDLERFGVINTGNPKHADILLLTGSINEQNKEVVQNIYAQMPDPKVVIALGICATSGGIFRECYNVSGGADKIVPVDLYVPNCPIRPEAIIEAAVQAIKILEQKREVLRRMSSGLEDLTISLATIQDATEILALQQLAYQSEAEIYGDFSLSPLKQTLQELRGDFHDKYFLKAVMSGKIVGSVRGALEGRTCHLSRLVVHPNYQNQGIGRKLMAEIEKHFAPSAQKYELFTSHKSRRNIFLYQKMGYRIFKTQVVSEQRQRVFMEKPSPKE